MEESEKLESDIKVYAPDVELKRTEVDRELAQLAEESRQVELRVSGLVDRRKQIVSAIPNRLLDVYERVARLRRGQALSEVRDGVCTACKMRLRPKVYSDVRKGDELIYCDNCSRILFYRPDTLQSAEAAMS
jgi:predicted  nucleic acid-binding Zn-ribbon protein